MTSQIVQAETPVVGSQVTFLYYKDLNQAAAFYEDVFGFQQVFDRGWVKMYRTSASSHVSLIDEAESPNKTSIDKPVMLAIETPDLAAWYEYVKFRGPEYIQRHMEVPGEGMVNSFLLFDPEGYQVEFFQWNEGYGFK